MQGPVLQSFSYDEAHPYAGGQHRGIDIGADAAGETVVAPAAGMVSFAGSLPTSGKSVTIDTADGYAVTLTHLGSLAVVKGARVAERDAVGTIGPSGTPDESGPYVHLGVRVAADPNGYVDPLGLLPPAAESGTSQGDATASQPASSSGSATAPASAASPSGSSSSGTPASKPAASVPASASVATTHRSGSRTHRAGASGRGDHKAQESRAEARPTRSSHRPVIRPTEEADPRIRQPVTPRPRATAPATHLRRPVVEPAASSEPTGLDTGHEPQPSRPPAQVAPVRRPAPAVPIALLCNLGPAFLALAAVFAARRSRRGRAPETMATADAQVLELRAPEVERRLARAA